MSDGLDDNDNDDVGKKEATDGSDVFTIRLLLLMEVLLSLLLLWVCCQHCLLSRHIMERTALATAERLLVCCKIIGSKSKRN